ncbi:MAG: tRNA pseudouridine(55) synthase TruB [Actinobacteria bacterium]|uniref:tRNA pseudouridine(55) synthase n=1 Tax=freshwater metagenome TaxID=449393 RepID=A0A6J6SSE0_9ZZZZ|nr:tRNA pseudouridine(55) synthase TruB [Actinomycetota bacterium]
MHGFALINKASGLTSHDVVAQARKQFGTKKVGHAGTLDPMATGVLVLGIGSATRLLQYVVDGSKRYEATIRLGQSTHTDDREGEVLATADASKLSDDEITSALANFVGKIQQKPSSVSAIKIDGKRAHQRVRDGEVVDIPARDVEVMDIQVQSIDKSGEFIDMKVAITCSAGTYIRAIARDLGDVLKVGGHLTTLHRTLVSPFDISECTELKQSELISVASAISRILPIRTIDLAQANEISFGRAIAASNQVGPVAALDQAGEFVALLLDKEQSGKTVATPTLVAVKE